MTQFTVLIYTTAAEAVAAHRPGTAWGTREATLVDGEWVGVAPFEIAYVSVDESSPVDTVPVPYSGGVLDAEWVLFEGAV